MSLSGLSGSAGFRSPRLAGDELHIPVLKQTGFLVSPCFWPVDVHVPCIVGLLGFGLETERGYLLSTIEYTF